MTYSLLAGRRILVVEDEVMVAIMLQDMLEDLGCRVVATTEDPEVAMAVIEGRALDAAILDVNLRAGTSFDVADALAARRLPYMFSTGRGGVEFPEPYNQRPVIFKPFHRGELEATLMETLNFHASGEGKPRA